MQEVERMPNRGVIECLWAEGEGGDGANVDAGTGTGEVESPDSGETDVVSGDASDGGDGKTADADAGASKDARAAHDAEGGEAEHKADGRNNPDAIRKHLAALKADAATAPLAKAITDGLGKKRGYEEVFPTVREAREVRQLLETVGGREAVTNALESQSAMRRMDAALAAGDPMVLKDIFEQAPEGMVKLGAPVLDEIARRNPQAYQAMIAPHVIGALEGRGWTGALNSLVDALNKDDRAGMKDILGRITKDYTAMLQGARERARPQQIDPERAKFEEEKKNFENEKRQQAIKGTFHENLAYSANKIEEGLRADVKRLGLSPKAVEKLRQDVWREIERRRNSDATFKNQVNLKFDGKTPKPDAVRFLNQYTDQNVKDAIDEVVTTYYGPRKAIVTQKINPTAPKKQVATAGKPSGQQPVGWTRVMAPPVPKEINYGHKDTDPFSGRAVLKDGRRVNWR